MVDCEIWYAGRAMAYGYDDAHQLVSVAATRPSDAARYRYDAAGNPVDRAELGLDITNSFNNVNQIVTGSWTGSTVTVAGSVNYPIGSISVNNTPGTVYPDSTFDVAGVPVAPGTNTLNATYVGANYSFIAGPAAIDWIGASEQTPAAPAAGEDVRVWTQTWPRGAGQGGVALYSENGLWGGVPLSKAGTTNGNGQSRVSPLFPDSL